MKNTTIFDCPVIEIVKHYNDAGSIAVIENGKSFPFEVNRVFYLYDVPGGEQRGGHAHKQLDQFIIAASGSFDVVLSDGNMKRTVSLNRPNYGLLLAHGIWGELNNFSSGAICLVLASKKYDESDYIRNYNDFLEYKK